MHTGFVSTMINWRNVDTSQKNIVTLSSDTGNTSIYGVCGRLVCIPSTVSMRSRGNPLPASSAQTLTGTIGNMDHTSMRGECLGILFPVCVRDPCDGWVWRRQIVDGIMVKWETVTEVICSRYLHLCACSPSLTTVSVTPPGIVSRFTFQEGNKNM